MVNSIYVNNRYIHNTLYHYGMINYINNIENKFNNFYMKLEINGTELDLHRTLRTDMVYEDITGKSFDINNINQHVLVDLFCASVIAAQQREGCKEMSKKEVMAWLEEDPIREMYIGQNGQEYAEQYIKYLQLVTDYYKNEEKKKKNKSNSVTIESEDTKKN